MSICPVVNRSPHVHTCTKNTVPNLVWILLQNISWIVRIFDHVTKFSRSQSFFILDSTLPLLTYRINMENCGPYFCNFMLRQFMGCCRCGMSTILTWQIMSTLWWVMPSSQHRRNLLSVILPASPAPLSLHQVRTQIAMFTPGVWGE